VFDHVTIRVSDPEASERFYDTVLSAIGIERTASGDDYSEWNDFSLLEAGAETPATRGLHIGFGAPSRELVDAFWQAGVEGGFESDGEPGPRPEYGDDYYGGFLLDPDGNSAEAVHHDGSRTGRVDHLWIRVADPRASKDFYETIAPHAGLGPGRDRGARVQYSGRPGSFSLVPSDRRTENLHMAFPAPDNGAIDAFHAAALRAGYRDRGKCVLDPDGNSIELVSPNL
jgi:catechol 2,3-dioxygenase-like lactoylglutathione lyase family enzyme